MLNLSRQHGISLIEMMIGLAIFGILVMAGLPSYTAWIQNTKIRNTAESVMSGLQLARAEALRRNTSVQFTFAADSDWTVSVANPLTTIQTRPSSQGSLGVTAVRTPSTSSTVTFNSLGRVVANADGTASFTQIDFDVPATILPADQSRDLRISVGSGGRVRLCDPNVTEATDTRYCS